MPSLRNILICVTALLIAGCESTSTKVEPPIKLVMIGDSTMAKKKESRRPETGWGEALGSFFNDSVTVSNHALNGRSSKSFIGEGHWDKAFDDIGAGDVLIVQFGHNDQKHKSPDRYTKPWEEYSDNLRLYTNAARSKGATVIIASSICRRKWLEDGSLGDTHGEYPDAAEAVAEELGVPYVDMEALSREMLLELGEEVSEALFMHLEPGENENYPDGKTDNTHLKPVGAKAHAKLFVDALKEMDHPLVQRMK